MKLNLLPKLVEKLVWVPVLSFCKISFPVTHLMPYYAETGRSRPLISPPNRLTLRMTFLLDLVFQTFHFVLFPTTETNMMNSTRHVP
jgi:hypothetical protein